MGVRELKKQRTEKSLADAAIKMFTERGYENVTMADVAAQAEVSRRTAFRYFASKDDLLMQHPSEWLEVFDASIAEHASHPLRARIHHACSAVAAHIEADPDPVRQLFALATTHPSIAGRYAVSSAQWIDRIAQEVRPDSPGDADARMLAAATMGIINAVCESWAATDQPMLPLLERGLDIVDPHLGTSESN